MKGRAMVLSHMGALAALVYLLAYASDFSPLVHAVGRASIATSMRRRISASMAAPAGAEIVNVTRPTGKHPALAAPYMPETTRAERRAARSNKKHKLKGLRP